MRKFDEALSPSTALGRLILFAGFVAVAFFCHWNALSIDFYGDDFAVIESKIGVLQRGLVPFLHVVPDRPLQMLSIWLNFKLGLLDQASCRATTLVFHAATAFTLFQLLWSLARKHLAVVSPRLPLGLALIYLVHPVHSQAIQIVAQRSVVFTGLFSTLTIWLFIESIEKGRRTHYTLSILAFLLAMASKANAIAIPPILLLYLAIFHRDRLRELALELLPHGVAAALPFIYYSFLDANPQVALPWHQYLLTQLRVLFLYFRLFFFPVRLRYLYDVDQSLGAFDPWTLAALAGHLAILAAALGLWREKRLPLLVFSVLAAYLAFLPESSVFPIHFPVWEYRTYLPFALLTIGALPLLRDLGAWNKALPPAMLALALAAAFVGDRARNAEVATIEKWENNTLQHDPHDFDYDTQLLAALLNSENVARGKQIVELIQKANPTVTEYGLFAKAFGYLTDPPARRERATLEQLGSALMRMRTITISIEGRSALDNFMYRHAGEFLSGLDLCRHLDDLFFAQLVFLDPNARPMPEIVRFLQNYQKTLVALTTAYDHDPHAAGLSKADQARRLRALMLLEVYFGRQTPGLSARFEAYLAEHHDDQATDTLFQWYKKMRTSRIKPGG